VFAISTENRAVRRLTEDGFFSPYWSHDGQWIYLTSAPRREMYDIWRMPARGGTPVQLTKKGGLAPQGSPDGKYLYYTKGNGGIWRMTASGGEEMQLLTDPQGGLRTYWRVVSGGIFYVTGNAAPSVSFELYFYDFATRSGRRVVRLPGFLPLYTGGLTVSSDGKRMVYSQVSRSGDDIMLVENFR